MEITRTNFTEKLDEIGEAIKEASFLAIDGEFTGLEKRGCSHAAPFDTPEERYMKMCETSLDFLLVQFGLCAFKYKEETQSYEARPFNFYVFPRPYTRQAPDRRFLCQSSSIDFLVQQGFDFNKVFREGIPYLTPVQEDEMREALNMKHQAFSKFSSPAFFSPDNTDMGPGKGPVMVPEDQKEFIATNCDKISKFLEEKGGPESVQLDPCNAFQRKLLYQTVRTKFSSVHLETKTGEKKERFIVVTRVASDEELKKKEKEKQNAEIMELEEAVGLSKVVKLISQSGKLVLGHNMMLDVMHMLNQFVCPLPEHLEEFKSMVRCCLPRLIDTKFMASSHPFRDLISITVLDHLQQSLQSDPFTPAKVVLPEDFKRYENVTDKQHEAGYDALVTGTVFATMANYLGKKEDNPKPVVEPSSSLLEPFLNKLFLMRLNDIPYLNLSGPDPVPNRDHVFHLTFPKEWKASEINNLFSAYGNIFISWINETSAFVSLYKKDHADAVLKSLGESQTQYRLLTYKEYRRTLAPSPHAGASLPPPSFLSPASACGPAPPSSQSTTPNRTALKRPAPRDDNQNNRDQSDLQPVSKKLCSVDSNTAGKQDDQSPDVGPTPQMANEAGKSGDAGASSTEMFDVPSVWE